MALRSIYMQLKLNYTAIRKVDKYQLDNENSTIFDHHLRPTRSFKKKTQIQNWKQHMAEKFKRTRSNIFFSQFFK